MEERRYIVSRERAETFLIDVAAHLAFCVHDPLRPVAYSRTTYFDTEDGAFLRSCGTGVARRLRLREYASAPDVLSPALLTGQRWIELKETRGRERTKFRAPAANGAEPWRDHPVLRRVLPDAPLTPRVTTWYRRLGLEGDGVRVTLDEGLVYCLPEPAGRAGNPGEPHHAVEYGPSRVLEVKFAGEPPGWLVAAMEALPDEDTTGFSKFWAASVALRKRAVPRAKHRTEPIVIPRVL